MGEENKKALEEREVATKEREIAQREREAAAEGRKEGKQEWEVERQSTIPDYDPVNLTEERRNEILKWLSLGELNSRHSIIGEGHTEGTGDWLLEEIHPWFEGTGPRLVVCQGAGGIRKTYLA